MRHMMMMGSMHGMAGFMMFHFIRRMAMRLVLLGLVVLVIVLWLRQRRQRNFDSGPW